MLRRENVGLFQTLTGALGDLLVHFVSPIELNTAGYLSKFDRMGFQRTSKRDNAGRFERGYQKVTTENLTNWDLPEREKPPETNFERCPADTIPPERLFFKKKAQVFASFYGKMSEMVLY